MYNILVCDDEPDIVSALKIYLGSEGYNVLCAYNGGEALEALRKNDVHLVLMDIMMPHIDGITALARIREISNVPVILLTAKSEDSDIILGLNVGADDYITKPFNPVEVTARVRSQLRRYMCLGSRVQNDSTLCCGSVELDKAAKTVTCDGDPISLTPTEFDILAFLMDNPGRVFSSKEIYNAVWRDALSNIGAENTIAVHIRHLREKIEINPAEPRILKVVWGQGYKIERGDK